MKMAMRQYCSLRMLGEYDRRYYIPGAQRLGELAADKAAEARRLAAQLKRLRALWPDIRIGSPNPSGKGPFRVGEHFEVQVDVHLGKLEPVEVCVQLYNGQMRACDDLKDILSFPMQVSQAMGVRKFPLQLPGALPHLGSIWLLGACGSRGRCLPYKHAGSGHLVLAAACTDGLRQSRGESPFLRAEPVDGRRLCTTRLNAFGDRLEAHSNRIQAAWHAT